MPGEYLVSGGLALRPLILEVGQQREAPRPPNRFIDAGSRTAVWCELAFLIDVDLSPRSQQKRQLCYLRPWIHGGHHHARRLVLRGLTHSKRDAPASGGVARQTCREDRPSYQESTPPIFAEITRLCALHSGYTFIVGAEYFCCPASSLPTMKLLSAKRSVTWASLLRLL